MAKQGPGTVKKKSDQVKNKQRHEVASGVHMSKIFTGELKPGTKLPTEKQLAIDMGIDRTSLRVALKQLEGMQLLEIRQGDGMYVKDYMENAGLDFLRMLVLDGTGRGRESPIFDEYLLDEIWEFWEIFLPQTVILASKKFSPRDLKAVMEILDRELEHIDDSEMIIKYELENQDLMARIANNMVLMLLFNSSRPLREKMLRVFTRHLTRKELKEHVLVKRKLLVDYSSGSLIDAVRGAEEYRLLLSKYRKKIIRVMRAKSGK
jgi:GntR family transcriptional regulator, transcriptional repressor for pyruvate dehydrogenase complex